MQATFEVFKRPPGKIEAVKRGFSWPGFFFTWIWALLSRLWLVGLVVLALSLIVDLLAFQLFRHSYLVFGLTWFVVRLVIGLRGNTGKSEALHDRGYQ